MAQLTEGQTIIQDFQDSGYTDQMIKSIKDQRSKAALDAGYSQRDIDAYWGDGPGVGTEVFTNLAKDNLNKVGWKYENLPLADPKNALDVFVASFGTSTSGLRYRRPKEQVPPTSEMSWGSAAANAAGSLIGDAGDMLVGMGGTFAATLNPVAAGSASMAYPEAIRRGYLYAYEKGNVSTANILEGMTKAPVEIAKAAIIGAVGGKASSVAYNTAEKIASPLVAGMAANITGALTSTGVGAGLNGEMPTLKDFTVAAAMMAMLPGSHYQLASSLFRQVGARGRVAFSDVGERLKTATQEVWAKTGVKPTDQARIAEVDALARQSILSRDVDGQVVTDGAWDKWRKPEPEPYKAPAPDKVEIAGGMKPVEEPVDQLTIAGKVNPDTGIAPVKSVTPEQVDALVDFDAPVTPDQAKTINEAARKYKNEDGSVDLEAVLIEHVAGEPAAQVFRASGRDYNTLDPKTQRFLEYAGKRLDEEGYAPEPKEGPGGGDGGNGGGNGGKPPGALPGPGEKPFDRAFEFAVEDVNAKVAKPVNPKETWGDTLRRFKANWRELSPLTGVDKMLGIGQKYGQIGIETIARLQYSANDRFMFRLNKGGGGYKVVTDKFGNPKYEANYDVPTMESIISRADKLEHGREGFRAFMQAQATLDMARPTGAKPKKTTTGVEEAMEIIEKVPAKERETYRELAHHYQRMMDDSLFGVMAHGGLNDEGFFKFKLDRPNYFPQKVYIEQNKQMGRGKLKYLFKKAKGHEFVLKDQFLSTMEVLQQREKFNSANITRLTAVRELRKAGYIKGSPEKGLVAYDPKTALKLDADGVPEVDKKFYEYDDKSNEIVYYDHGHKLSETVEDFPGRDVFMKALLSENVFERETAVAFFTKAAKFTRATITSMPAYMFRMLVRDSPQHATFSKYGGTIGFNLVRGAFDIIDHAAHGKLTGGENLSRGKAKVDEAMLNGAYVGGQIAMDFDALLNSYTRLEHTGFGGGVLNFAHHPAQFIYRVLRGMDATVRIGGTYTGAREKFGSLAAADMARKLGGDFAEKSSSAVLNQVASMTPFWTGFQRSAVDSVVTMLKNDPVGFGLRSIKNVTIPAIAFYALTSVMEDLYDVPEPDRQHNRDRKFRDNNWIIPIPMHGELHNFIIPLNFGIGSIFSSPVWRLLDKWRYDDPRAFKDWAVNIATGFTSGALPVVDNPAINAALEGASGYDFNFGKQIVPARFEHVSGYNAYQPWTS